MGAGTGKTLWNQIVQEGIMLTNEELLEIEARANKASPGPWMVEPDLRPDIKNEEVFRAAHDIDNQINAFRYLQKKNYEKQNATVHSTDGKSGYCGEGQIVREMSKSIGHVCELAKFWGENHSNMDDAEFIACARTDIPKLIEEVRRLKAFRKQRK
jgi:hypothetical protein